MIRNAVFEGTGTIEFVEGETMLPSIYNSIFLQGNRTNSLESLLFISEDGSRVISNQLRRESTPAHLIPSSRSFRIFKYKNSATDRQKILYKCDNRSCPKIYTKRHNFLDHMRTHSGYRPFECPFFTGPGC